MEKYFKAIILVMLVAFIVVGTTGCRKKGDDLDGVLDGDLILIDDVPPVEVFAPDVNSEVYKMIHFDYDKSDIRDDAKPVLDNIAMDLKASPGKYILVEGHCDERGTSEYNLALGERRALTTREYLADLGVDPDKIVTISYGEERALELGHDDSAWSVNRRAEFKTYIQN